MGHNSLQPEHKGMWNGKLDLCSCSLMAEPLPSKQMVRVRFSSIAPYRDVTQFGRVLALGARCRRFESCRLDLFMMRSMRTLCVASGDASR